MKEQIFKKGDRVFCIIYGWGTISKIGKNYYPIDIEFDCNVINSYTIDGRITEGGSPTLSFTEYTLEGFSQERPEPLPKRGDVVWVRDDDDEEWQISFFVKKEGIFYVCTRYNPESEYYLQVWNQLTTKKHHLNETAEA